MPDNYLINVVENCMKAGPSFLQAFDFNAQYNNYLRNVRDL